MENRIYIIQSGIRYIIYRDVIPDCHYSVIHDIMAINLCNQIISTVIDALFKNMTLENSEEDVSEI